MFARSLSIAEFPIEAALLGNILQRLVAGSLTLKGGREVFAEFLSRYDAHLETENAASLAFTPATIDEIVREHGLEVVRDDAALESAMAAALAESPKAVEDFRAGKQQALGAIVGKVMKQLKGADAKAVREALIAKLNTTT